MIGTVVAVTCAIVQCLLLCLKVYIDWEDKKNGPRISCRGKSCDIKDERTYRKALRLMIRDYNHIWCQKIEIERKLEEAYDILKEE
jgi:hypothetical protein